MADLLKNEGECPKEFEGENENPFTQLCVIHGLILNEKEIAEFEEFILKEMGCRVKYHTQVKTNPDKDNNGNDVPETGGRNDLMFYIHSEDIPKFALPRMAMGIRWWEDVVKYNDNSYLYTKEFLEAHPPTW